MSHPASFQSPGFGALVAVGLPALLGRPLGEVATSRAVGTGFAAGFLAAVATLLLLLVRGFRPELVEIGRAHV